MKAMLVFDKPECCELCYLSMQVPQGSLCRATTRDKNGRKVNGCFGTMPSWCPLKPIPQKKEVEVNKIDDIMRVEYSIEDIYNGKYVADIMLETDKLIAIGYNGCIDEILGDSNGK